MEYQNQGTDLDLEKPSHASMEEYSAFIRAEASHSPRRPQLHITPCTGGLVGTALLLLLTACIYLLLLLRNLPLEHDATHGPYIECPEIALHNNPPDCTFDLFAHGWVPSPCFDAQMHKGMVATQKYEFFRSRLGDEKITQDVVLQGNRSLYNAELWASYPFHVDSCLYLLNGSVRATAMRSGGTLDSWVDGGLMQHCLDLIREKRDPKKIDTRVKTAFGSRKCFLGR
ncbi:hypothetical protein BJY00DRAFT_312346 [Aspergillus carlsbadensis]|nr:hypothetical protein BJY00DRAFT_312346 [Aspergillus carlsbadensis]